MEKASQSFPGGLNTSGTVLAQPRRKGSVEFRLLVARGRDTIAAGLGGKENNWVGSSALVEH